MQRGSCPSCGAAVVFANKGSLALVCDFCRTVVRRQGADLSAYGTVGEIKDDASPLMIGSEGRFDQKPFQVVGRLQNRFADGTWNEWHIGFEDGSFGWLAEATGFWSVFRPVMRNPPDRDFESYEVGDWLNIGKTRYYIKQRGNARCVAAEGSLPFPVSGEYDLPFVDLVSTSDECATLDFSDGAPKLFTGRTVQFEELELKNLREELPADHPMARIGSVVVEKVACPSCGGGLERRTGLESNTMHCPYCGAGLDLNVEPYRIFAKQEWSGLDGLFVPLGAKGTFEGEEFVVLAHLVREAVRWGVQWQEYLLHNPKKGYRWLILSDGHFTWAKPMHEWPEEKYGRFTARGQQLKFKEANEVAVRRVAGELYWRVKAGQTTQAYDYTKPPFMLSREEEGQEVNWTLGEYISGKAVWKAFGLEGSPPRSYRVAPHQPAPADAYFKPMLWRWAAAIAIIIAATIVYSTTRDTLVVADKTLPVTHPNPAVYKKPDQLLDKNTWWVGPIEVDKGPIALQIDLSADLANNWIYAAMALYDEEKGDALTFGQEIAYYKGPDWSEGANNEQVIIPAVKKGVYWLRVEVQTDPKLRAGGVTNVRLRVTKDVPLSRWPWLAASIITLPLFIVGLLKMRFEMRRNEEE